jgi:hypothetical protein
MSRYTVTCTDPEGAANRVVVVDGEVTVGADTWLADVLGAAARRAEDIQPNGPGGPQPFALDRPELVAAWLDLHDVEADVKTPPGRALPPGAVA